MGLLEHRQPLTYMRFPPKPEKLFRSEEGRIVSKETYFREYYHHPDFNYEWVNGRLEEKPMSNYLTMFMYNWLVEILKHYLQVHNCAIVTTLEMGFEVPLPPKKWGKKKTNVRKPDLGVVLHSNPIRPELNTNRYDGIFDLCVEALSYTTKKAKERDTVEKKEEYEYADVKEFFLLDDRGIETAFYRLNQWGYYEKIKPIDGDVIRSEVLPGFQFRLSDLYKQTPPEELVKDEVYRGFIMVHYQKAEEEKEQERKLKEQAYQRAQQAEQKAEAEKLRALRAEQEKERAEQEAEAEKLRALQAEQKAEAEKLRALQAEQEKQRAKQQAEAEKLRALQAEQEKQRAEQQAEAEKLRAQRLEQEKEEVLKQAEEDRKEKERLAAILKQLGISLDPAEQ